MNEPDKTVNNRRIVLAGNPNTGKSVVFNRLTGIYAEVSNYPGTTVDITTGKFNDITIVDTPGIYGAGSLNEEETVATAILLDNTDIINVVSAVSLERDLFLTQQLIDMRFNIIIVLNQMDEATSRGIIVDVNALQQRLGVNIYPAIAIKNIGIEELKSGINEFKKGNATPEVTNILSEKNFKDLSTAQTLLALEEDETIISKYPEHQFLPLKEQIYTARRNYLHQILNQCISHTDKGVNLSTRLGHLLIRPFWGGLAALLVLFLLYQFVGVVIAQNIVGLTEGFIETHYIPIINRIVSGLSLPGWLSQILSGEYGLLTMTVQYIIGVLLPLVVGFYLFFALLEDSGYLPRLAVLADSLFTRIGLNGKAIIPILLGFGCITMAIISTRILGTKRERLITIAILALTIPCSAQLGIIVGLLAITGSFMAWIIYVLTILAVLLVASWILNKFLSGESSPLILDLPTLKLPDPLNVIQKTLYKTWLFLYEATIFFVLGTFLLSILSITGGLEWLQNFLSPVVVDFLGLPKEVTNVFVMGLIRRDFGTAGLASFAGIGGGESILNTAQILVSIVVITLFVPCIAAVMVIFKERGWFDAILLWISSIIVAFGVGGILSYILKLGILV